MPDLPILLSETNALVLKLTLNRPPVNALNFELIAALQQALKQAEHDPQIRCVLLTGAGTVFSAGQDLNSFAAGQKGYRAHLLRTYNPLILQLRRLEKPIIAALNGPVSGAALGLALACDLRIAADSARFVVGFAGIGLAPDSGVSLLLPALIGFARATEFTFSNAPITADQALAWGLINRVVPTAELPTIASNLAAGLAHGPIGALALAKRAFNQALLGNLESVLDYEAHLQEIASASPEHAEGVQAFLEKRPPRFV